MARLQKWRNLSLFGSCSRNGQVHLVPRLLQQLAFALGNSVQAPGSRSNDCVEKRTADRCPVRVLYGDSVQSETVRQTLTQMLAQPASFLSSKVEHMCPSASVVLAKAPSVSINDAEWSGCRGWFLLGWSVFPQAHRQQEE